MEVRCALVTAQILHVLSCLRLTVACWFMHAVVLLCVTAGYYPCKGFYPVHKALPTSKSTAAPTT